MYPSARKYHRDTVFPRYNSNINRSRPSPEDDFDWPFVTQHPKTHRNRRMSEEIDDFEIPRSPPNRQPPRHRRMSEQIDDFELPRSPLNRQQSRHVPYPVRRPQNFNTPRMRSSGMRSVPFTPWNLRSHESDDDEF